MADDPLKNSLPRLFLAMPFHEAFPEEIGCALERLSRRIPGIRWVRPEQAHLTLHFFGATPYEDIARIDPAMREVASRFPPLDVCLDQCGGFPDLKRPQVIWLGVRDKGGALLALCQAVRDAVMRLGFAVEERPFRAHITVGRVKKKCADLEPLIREMGLPFPTAAKVLDHFALYQSHCLPDGARYEKLKTYSLKKTP